VISEATRECLHVVYDSDSLARGAHSLRLYGLRLTIDDRVADGRAVVFADNSEINLGYLDLSNGRVHLWGDQSPAFELTFNLPSPAQPVARPLDWLTFMTVTLAVAAYERFRPPTGQGTRDVYFAANEATLSRLGTFYRGEDRGPDDRGVYLYGYRLALDTRVPDGWVSVSYEVGEDAPGGTTFAHLDLVDSRVITQDNQPPTAARHTSEDLTQLTGATVGRAVAALRQAPPVVHLTVNEATRRRLYEVHCVNTLDPGAGNGGTLLCGYPLTVDARMLDGHAVLYAEGDIRIGYLDLIGGCAHLWSAQPPIPEPATANPPD
jgi:hypothetical protein